MQNEKAILEVVEYTDPYCTWCWGSEPILRKIKEKYGNQVKVNFKMGGLVADIKQFYDPANQIGGINWYKQVASHWIDASNRHGMPVDGQVFYDIKDEAFSTYPANIAYKSAELQDEELAKKFLRRMREGAAAERKVIQRIEVQAKLAEEAGLKKDQFIEDIKSGRAEKEFLKDLKEARSRGITGFPTFLIRSPEGKEVILHGYQSFKRFEQAFDSLKGGDLKPLKIVRDENNILKFIKKYQRAAPKEVSEVFDLTTESAMELLSSLKEKGKIKEEKVGNGFFYSV
ncbi:MAG: DsbA family protein [Candidatus Hydrothermarchaeales archaeon]